MGRPRIDRCTESKKIMKIHIGPGNPYHSIGAVLLCVTNRRREPFYVRLRSGNYRFVHSVISDHQISRSDKVQMQVKGTFRPQLERIQNSQPALRTAFKD